MWRQMGSPPRLNLVELGPGRGTLMGDAIRASRIVPGFHAALAIHLVESNSALIDTQRETLGGLSIPVTWHGEVPRGLAPAPTLLIANEYLDAMPVDQIVFHGGAWHIRHIGIDSAGEFGFEIGGRPVVAPPERITSQTAEGDIWEFCEEFAQFAKDLQSISQRGSFAALLVDYGHLQSSLGETLQCVRAHQAAGIFDMPGLADMTAYVDFERLASEARRLGLSTDGPVTQAEFLGRLGISERASRLMGSNPDKAGGIESGVARLMAPNGMGGRFKAIGLRSPDLPPLPGFASANDSA
jgi:SAM-dependent MidA family methyltransferase